MRRIAARFPYFSGLRWLLAAAFLMLSGGCGEPPAVRTYQVAKPTPPTRMLAAMIPVEGGAWFFKAMGRHSSITAQAEAFWDFLETVRFDERSGEPAWDLPEGWRERPPRLGEMRYSTLIMPGDFPVEIAVSSFDRPPSLDEQEFALANINRWRRQLSAAEVTSEELEAAIRRRPAGPLEALCVDLSGKEAPRGGMAAMPPRRDAAATPAFDAPASWEDRPLKPLRPAM